MPLYSVVDGNDVQAEDINQIIDALNSISTNRPAVRATLTGTQSIGNSTETSVTFNGTDQFDTQSLHDPALNNTRITIPVTGIYLVIAQISFAINGTGYRECSVRINGTTYILPTIKMGAHAGASTGLAPHVSLYQFTAADYIEVRAFQTSGGALNINDASFMAMQMG